MADEKNFDGVVAEENDSQNTEEQMTAEKVDSLVKARLEQERKEWQSRFDKIRNEKSEAEKALEDSNKTWEQRLEEKVSSFEKLLEDQKSEARMAELRSQALKTVSSAKLELDDVEEKLIYRLIDSNADDPLADVKAYVKREQERDETRRLAVADEFAKKNGRKVTSNEAQEYSNISYKDMAAMSEAEFNKIPREIVDQVMQSALQKE